MIRHKPGARRGLLIFLAACGVNLFPASHVEAEPRDSSSSVDACLPFSMPDSAALFGSNNKVFAHYFYPFPLQIDNKPAAQDYYNRNYLNKNGESDKWLAKGGFLRQRPLPIAGGPATNYQLANMEQEIRMAIARGITGFTIDVMNGAEASGNDSHLQNLLKAASAVDPRFKIVVMPDLSALKSDANAVTQIIASVAASPAAYRLSDNRLVVTAFNAGVNPPQWWSGIFDQLKSQGINVAFVPTFLGWKGQADSFSGISYGLSDWGTATASFSNAMKNDVPLAHGHYGKVFMMPVDPQQYRPKDGNFWEAGNSAAFRSSWSSAIDGGAEWVQIVTWSDFSESSQIEPYTDNSLRRDIGTGYYDLNAYYAAWFLTGKQPTVTHDLLYFFYRREPSNAATNPPGQPNKVVSSTPEDSIEVLAFLTAPGTVKISIGGQSTEQDAAAGMTSFKVPTHAGTPVFSLSRNGAEIISFTGPIQIYGPEGIPAGVIDMTYWSGSASKSGLCAL